MGAGGHAGLPGHLLRREPRDPHDNGKRPGKRQGGEAQGLRGRAHEGQGPLRLHLRRLPAPGVRHRGPGGPREGRQVPQGRLQAPRPAGLGRRERQSRLPALPQHTQQGGECLPALLPAEGRRLQRKHRRLARASLRHTLPSVRGVLREGRFPVEDPEDHHGGRHPCLPEPVHCLHVPGPQTDAGIDVLHRNVRRHAAEECLPRLAVLYDPAGPRALAAAALQERRQEQRGAAGEAAEPPPAPRHAAGHRQAAARAASLSCGESRGEWESGRPGLVAGARCRWGGAPPGGVPAAHGRRKASARWPSGATAVHVHGTWDRHASAPVACGKAALDGRTRGQAAAAARRRRARPSFGQRGLGGGVGRPWRPAGPGTSPRAG
mmetsp:Transcript_55454/g.172084  ORF Transcript_55454/g.172084 Transcript_55454/m.172084 type:complete len:378 (-) Transcript_55454:82-1215(-)